MKKQSSLNESYVRIIDSLDQMHRVDEFFPSISGMGLGSVGRLAHGFIGKPGDFKIGYKQGQEAAGRFVDRYRAKMGLPPLISTPKPEEKPKPLSKPIVGRDASKTLGVDKGPIDLKPEPKGFDFGARSSVPSISTAGINTNPMLMRSVYAPTPKPSTPVTGDDASKVLGPQPSAPIGGVNTKFKAGGLTKTFLPKPAPSSFTAGIDPSKIGSEYGINPNQPKETKKQRMANRSAARRNKTRPATSPRSLRSHLRYQRRMKNYQQQTSSTHYGDIAKLIRESFQLNEGKKKNLRIIAAAEGNPTNPSLQSAAEDARSRIKERERKIAGKMTWQTTDDELRGDAAKRTSDNKTERGRNRAKQRLAGLRLQRNVPTGQRVPRHRS